jgi:hypothetical protein
MNEDDPLDEFTELHEITGVTSLEELRFSCWV